MLNDKQKGEEEQKEEEEDKKYSDTLTSTDFESYEERLNQIFIVNNIEEEKKTALFITISGEAMYDICKSFTTPDKPSTKKYSDLIDLIKKHFTAKRNKRAERYKFNKVSQKNGESSGESLREFIIRLKNASHTCEFRDLLYKEHDPAIARKIAEIKLKILDKALTDRFVTGLRYEKIKQQLFSDEKADFEKCCEKALQFEMVEKDS
ncbi:hypothetical protein HA402_005122 [Bradysia odoriphaga]|nr:hypothetical protein HA402_005122 [Bradysia odoriphaga]